MAGAPQAAVLRRFVKRDWLAREPDLAEREARNLVIAWEAGLAAPRLVAVDADGSTCDVPAILMTRVPGEVVLDPADLTAWVAPMAALLHTVHSVPVDPARVPSYHRYNQPGRVSPPHWSHAPSGWREAIRIVAELPPSDRNCFIHRDFHPGNVLWEDGSITGLVDWVVARWGPAEVDVGHCRANLAMLHGQGAADAFLDSYRRAIGGEPYDLRWDLVAAVDLLPGPMELRPWQETGRSDLTAALVGERIDAFVAAAGARL